MFVAIGITLRCTIYKDTFEVLNIAMEMCA